MMKLIVYSDSRGTGRLHRPVSIKPYVNMQVRLSCEFGSPV